MSDSILVRWQSFDGWREGVLCVVCCHHDTLMVPHNMREAVKRGSFGTAVIWDRTRNERAIVQLNKVRLIEPRCSKCDGEGTVFVRDVSGGALKFCECRKL